MRLLSLAVAAAAAFVAPAVAQEIPTELPPELPFETLPPETDLPPPPEIPELWIDEALPPDLIEELFVNPVEPPARVRRMFDPRTGGGYGVDFDAEGVPVRGFVLVPPDDGFRAFLRDVDEQRRAFVPDIMFTPSHEDLMRRARENGALRERDCPPCPTCPDVSGLRAQLAECQAEGESLASQVAALQARIADLEAALAAAQADAEAARDDRDAALADPPRAQGVVIKGDSISSDGNLAELADSDYFKLFIVGNRVTIENNIRDLIRSVGGWDALPTEMRAVFLPMLRVQGGSFEFAQLPDGRSLSDAVQDLNRTPPPSPEEMQEGRRNADGTYTVTQILAVTNAESGSVVTERAGHPASVAEASENADLLVAKTTTYDPSTGEYVTETHVSFSGQRNGSEHSFQASQANIGEVRR